MGGRKAPRPKEELFGQLDAARVRHEKAGPGHRLFRPGSEQPLQHGDKVPHSVRAPPVNCIRKADPVPGLVDGTPERHLLDTEDARHVLRRDGPAAALVGTRGETLDQRAQFLMHE